MLLPHDSQDPREVGYYFALAQVGLEMVVPLGIGLYLDHLFDWSPWALIVGTVAGFVGGLFHLVSMVKRHDAQEKARRDDRANRNQPPREDSGT